MTIESSRLCAAYPYDLPPKLAEWLVHGELSSVAVEAFISLVCEQEARRLGADDAWAAWLHGVLRHLTSEHASRLETRRDLTRHAIKRTVRTMVERREPSRRLLAEAHNCNQDYGYPLDEAEVAIEAAGHLQPFQPRRPRRG